MDPSAAMLDYARRRPGAQAVLAFESRNPAARAWEGWRQEEPEIRDTLHGPLAERCEVTEQDHGRVLLRFDNHFLATGETIRQDTLLTFRDQPTLARQLQAVGFEVTALWGSWRRSPFLGQEPLMVFEVRTRV